MSQAPGESRDRRATAEPAPLPPPHTWEFAGWGTAERITDLEANAPIQHLDQPRKHLLGEWRATALCGNDITSSVLYVSALCAAEGGVLAPFVLLLVSAVLYLYRRVYAEVGSALPLNGGTYTVLLNTTGKRVAAGAACLTLLSYVATAVISASEAMNYAQHLMPGLLVFPATIVLLAIFAALNVMGVSESAVVALVIFVIHIATLVILLGFGVVAVVRDPSLFAANWRVPEPHGIGRAIFFGFAAAMLGISGFESSANFIEEQQRGVFPKTLRNMWLAVAVFNPLTSLLSFGLLPLALIRTVPTDLLARMGTEASGQWLGTLISIDAVLVLSGAVLTSYVGVTGLMRRMTLDRCLPSMSKQRTFGDLAWDGKKKVTRREQFLAEMDAVVPWEEFVRLVTPVYPKGERGRAVMPLRMVLRIYFVQQWFNLSDPAAEDALDDSESIRRFVGVDLSDDAVPDESTILGSVTCSSSTS